MKQQRVWLLVLIGLSLATVLWMGRAGLFNPSGKPVADPVAPLPQAAPVAQQMAIETAPLPAPQPAAEPQPVIEVVAEPAQPAPVIAAAKNKPGISSYIQFTGQIDNYNVQNGEISWRSYREYRRFLAKSLS